MNTAPQIVMIADDLSGAADCAAACAVQGLRTVVHISESPAASAQVLSIDAATRSLPADRAAAVIARLVAEHADAPVLFKKLDSLLRGHVGAELAAMRCAYDPAVIVMAPALPAHGRKTIGGCQWWNGAQVADCTSIVARAGLTCSLIGLADVRGESSELVRRMSALAATHAVLVCDAETDADLKTIAEAVAALPRAIWAGSSGLARYIPEAIGVAGASPPLGAPHFEGPILVLVGSRTAMAREQAHEAACREGLEVVQMSPLILRGARRGTLRDALVARRDTMVTIDTSDEIAEDPMLCGALAEAIRPYLKNTGALIATGGETARAVLLAAEVTGLRLLEEIEPGVPLAVSTGARQMPVITKSGSFGNRETLAHCVRVLRGLKLE